MKTALRKPVIIAMIVAAVSIVTFLAVDTNLIIDWRPPATPLGTTFNAANSVGAAVNPTQPESSITPTPPGPRPVQPANPTK